MAKPKVKENKTRQLTILLKPSVYKAIQQLREEQDRSSNQMIGVMLDYYLKHHTKIKEE